MNLNPRQSGVERALLCRDAAGVIVILRTDGPWIAADVEANGIYAEDIGLVKDRDCPNAGLYLFTGTCRMEPETWESSTPTEPVWSGKVVELPMGDLAEFFAMTPPTTTRKPATANGA